MKMKIKPEQIEQVYQYQLVLETPRYTDGAEFEGVFGQLVALGPRGVRVPIHGFQFDNAKRPKTPKPVKVYGSVGAVQPKVGR